MMQSGEKHQNFNEQEDSKMCSLEMRKRKFVVPGSSHTKFS